MVVVEKVVEEVVQSGAEWCTVVEPNHVCKHGEVGAGHSGPSQGSAHSCSEEAHLNIKLDQDTKKIRNISPKKLDSRPKK